MFSSLTNAVTATTASESPDWFCLALLRIWIVASYPSMMGMLRSISISLYLVLQQVLAWFFSNSATAS